MAYVTDNEAVIHFLTNVAAVFNVWYIVTCWQTKELKRNYVLLLHLSVIDMIHQLHAGIFYINVIAINSTDLLSDTFWLKMNQFIGITISTASILSVIIVVLKELGPSTALYWRVREFITEHGQIWTGAVILALPVFLFTDHPYYVSLTRSPDDDEPVPISQQSHISLYEGGISSTLEVGQLPLHRSWLFLLECINNPLWFPIGCFCTLPLMAFALIKRELWHSKASPFDLQPTQPSSLMIKILLLYYGIFLYDIYTFANMTEESSDRYPLLSFTHLSYNDRDSIVVFFMFFHWTRPFASILRNLFIVLERKAGRIQKETLVQRI